MKRKYLKNSLSWLMPFIIMIMIISCNQVKKFAVKVDGKNIRIEFNNQLHSRVIAKFDNQKSILGDFLPSEFVTVSGKDVTDFLFENQKVTDIKSEAANIKQSVITGKSDSLRKEIVIDIYDNFPTLIFFQVKYTNIGTADLFIDKWTNHHYSIRVKSTGENELAFWSYQSASYENRPDWVLPLKPGFHQQNYLGMNASDYGGGTPVIDVWRKDAGIAVGHVELVPKLVSLPVSMPDSQFASLAISYNVNKSLKPGESLTTFLTFVAVHQGDYFQTLTEYRRFMIGQGIKFKETPQTAYEPIWCAWGYERNFTMDQIFGTFPIVKRLGFEWAVLDDGWQTAEGDWDLEKTRFPNGDADMKKFVDKIHAEGLKAKLWWAPLAVDPGTDLIKDHPDYLLLNQDSSRQDISWWDAYYLCPAYPPVQQYTKNLVIKIMKEWG
ncbi:MAG: alpha-galactosidase, partial [bacterium]